MRRQKAVTVRPLVSLEFTILVGMKTEITPLSPPFSPPPLPPNQLRIRAKTNGGKTGLN